VNLLTALSGVLLTGIVIASIYLWFADWRLKKRAERADEFATPAQKNNNAANSSGAPDSSANNRYYRRLEKKDKKRER
jgi:hypothetical protein